MRKIKHILIVFLNLIVILTQCSCNFSNTDEFLLEDYIKYYFLVSVHNHKLVDINGLNCGDFDFHECTFEIDKIRANENSYIVNTFTPNGCKYYSDHRNYGIIYSDNFFKILIDGRPLDSMIVYKKEIDFLVEWSTQNFHIKDSIISEIASYRYHRIFESLD